MAIDDITKLGVESTYTDVVQDIYRYFGSDAYLEAGGFSGKYSPEKLIYWANRAGYNVETAKNGNILGYYKKEYIPVSNAINNTLSETNSNLHGGTASVANTVQFSKALETTVDSTGNVVASGGLKRFVNGVSETMNKPIGQVGHVVVPGHILPAIAAASAGIKLGKGIDSAIYNIGNAMGLNPPESLNPDTWGSITQDLSDTGSEGIKKTVFNALFDIDGNNNTQMYIDQNAFAYMAQWVYNQGILANGKTIEITGDRPTSGKVTIKTLGTKQQLLQLVNSGGMDFSKLVESLPDNAAYATLSNYEVITPPRSNQALSIAYTDKIKIGSTYDTNTSIHATGVNAVGIDSTGKITDPKHRDVNYLYKLGFFMHGPTFGEYDGAVTLQVGLVNAESIRSTGEPDGVSLLPNATVPDLSSATDTQSMLNLLKTIYPDLWNNRIENNVVQPDGNTITYTYIPVPMPTGGNGEAVDTTTATQPATAESPTTSTSPAEQIATLLKIITHDLPQGMTDPKAITDPEPGTNPLNPTDNPNPPATGSGDSPTVVVPTGSASSLYAIYNPTLAQINSFGAWLWSDNFIEQIKKLFNDPMQAIIGLHKIYATPATGGEQNIKVGYLDSGVPSKVVSDQYTTIDCGAIDCYEYFGNVFDYSPYTVINLYLPFIGIVSLDNADVMRSSIHIIYHVDVLSGACLAEVKVTRDGAGGTLYQYTGNASVTLPISSGSYMGIVASIASIAGGVAGTIASGGAAVPLITASIGSALNARAKVEHSGGFSGNAGAMGGKIPYIIISRPQVELADSFQKYIGFPANYTTKLGDCSGYVKVLECHIENVNATNSELTEIDSLLKSGVII